MGKYFHHLKMHIERHLAYRARVVIWVFVDIIPVFIFPFLWLSLYGTQELLNGFSRADIVTYYVVSTIVYTITSSHSSRLVRDDIIKGELNQFLLKPLNYLIARPIRELSYKVLLSALIIPGGILFFLFLPEYLSLPTQGITWVLLAVSLLLGYILSVLMQMIIGLVAFWLGETQTLEQLDHVLTQILAGRLAPLSFLPGILQSVAMFLPFRLTVYLPTQIYLEKMSQAEIIRDGLSLLAWIAGLGLIMIFLWKRGVKQYDGVGI